MDNRIKKIIDKYARENSNLEDKEIYRLIDNLEFILDESFNEVSLKLRFLEVIADVIGYKLIYSIDSTKSEQKKYKDLRNYLYIIDIYKSSDILALRAIDNISDKKLGLKSLGSYTKN